MPGLSGLSNHCWLRSGREESDGVLGFAFPLMLEQRRSNNRVGAARPTILFIPSVVVLLGFTVTEVHKRDSHPGNVGNAGRETV